MKGDRLDEAVEMHADGHGTAVIAGALACSQRRVQQMLAAAGVAAERPPVHPDLEEVVEFEAKLHGPNYGVKMLLGALHAHHRGYSFPRRPVLDVLHRLNPEAFEARRHWASRRIGRGVYEAPHFMYSVHMDLACKLQEYNILVGASIDGCTHKALELVAMTDKLPTTVHDDLYLPTCAAGGGAPDQLVTDKGKEWCIAAFSSLVLAQRAEQAQPAHVHAGRRRRRRRAHRFVPSKRNIRVERFNYEINMRVLVPPRRLINVMTHRGILDKYDALHVIAFSRIMCPLVQFGLDLLKVAWNHHRISKVRYRGRTLPGSGGVPEECAKKAPHPGGQLQLPMGFDGVDEYERARGKRLRRMSAADETDRRFCPSGRDRERRDRKVADIIGNLETAWMMLQKRRYSRFIEAYECFLSYY